MRGEEGEKDLGFRLRLFPPHPPPPSLTKEEGSPSPLGGQERGSTPLEQERERVRLIINFRPLIHVLRIGHRVTCLFPTRSLPLWPPPPPADKKTDFYEYRDCFCFLPNFSFTAFHNVRTGVISFFSWAHFVFPCKLDRLVEWGQRGIFEFVWLSLRKQRYLLAFNELVEKDGGRRWIHKMRVMLSKGKISFR